MGPLLPGPHLVTPGKEPEPYRGGTRKVGLTMPSRNVPSEGVLFPLIKGDGVRLGISLLEGF